jgi:D-alanyl-D-alanine carboxypeptidase
LDLSLPYRLAACAFSLIGALVLTGTPALAAKHRHAAAPVAHLRGLHRGLVRMPASPTDPAKDAALVVDGVTGKVLYARNETAERHPASLTKMMTLYLLFDALKQGKVTMQTPLAVSYHASIQKPTKLGLRPGQTIPVDTAIRAIVIRSANDVAVTIAEAIGGTESHFAEMMTQKARQIGMRETNFHNASGLPDPLQITTASDLAVLAKHLAYDYPQYFPYFGLAGFSYKGAWFPTHDNLIGRYEGADGIKTGYTGASGFNLVSSVTRGNTHVIAVVMGGRTAVRRDLEMVRLLDQTFTQIAANPNLVAKANVPWKMVASAAPLDTSAPSMNLPQVAGGQYAAYTPVPSTVQAEDEDSAEKVRAPDENFSVIHAEGAKQPAVPAVPPAKQQLAAKPAPAKPAPAKPALVAAVSPAKGPASPAVRPDPKLASQQNKMVQVAVAQPQIRPSVKDDGEGDADPAAPGRNWTVQIGAYADKALAQAQLKAFAGKAQDVLARAEQIVSQSQNRSGHTMYRARFGLYAKEEARNVCSQLTQRGQACFAVMQSR